MGESLLNKTNMLPVTVSNGGTGATTLTSGGILIGAGTNAITTLSTLTVAKGGTGATTASDARANLELMTEYGTWTPTLGNSSPTQPTVSSYGYQYGFYYVIGSLVYVSCEVKFRCSASGDAYACINGLPYACKSTTTAHALSRRDSYYALTSSYPTAIIRPGESYMLLKDQVGHGYCTWATYDGSHDQYIGFSGCYLRS